MAERPNILYIWCKATGDSRFLQGRDRPGTPYTPGDVPFANGEGATAPGAAR